MNFSIKVDNPTSFDSLKVNTLNSGSITSTAINSNSFLSPFQFQSISQNSADTTTITGLNVDSNKWIGGVLAPNGKIYGIPYSSTNVLIIDPDSPVVDITALYGINVATATYSGSVLTAGTTLLSGLVIGDNIIITTSSNIKYMGYIQSLTNTTMTLVYPLGVTLIAGNITKLEKTRKADITTITVSNDTGKWHSGVLAPNGKIYGIPFNSTSVLIIDPMATPPTVDTTTITGLSSSRSEEHTSELQSH